MSKRRTAAQRRAARITSYRRLGWKAFYAGAHRQADIYFRQAERLQREHERETEREAARRA